MVQNVDSLPKLLQLNRVKLSHIYLHSLKLRKSIQTLEKSFELLEVQE